MSSKMFLPHANAVLQEFVELPSAIVDFSNYSSGMRYRAEHTCE